MSKLTLVPSLLVAMLVSIAPNAAAQQLEEEANRRYPYLTPSGDLDGDGRGDLIGVGNVGDTDGTYRITAYRGSDGSVLWSREEAGVITALSARVGPSASPGLLLTVVRGSGFQTFSGSMGAEVDYVENHLTLVGLTGSGTELWRRTFESENPTVITTQGFELGTDVPHFVGTGQVVAGQATDAVVIQNDYVPGTEGQQNHTTALVVNGADGAIASTYDASIGASTATARMAPDLSGDGRDDLLMFVDADEGADTISALSGSQVLWSTTEHAISVNAGFSPAGPPGLQQRVVHLGDTSGDGISDVGFSAATVNSPAAREVAVLDGASGETAFVTGGDLVRPVGDVDRDGLAEVGTQTIHVGSREAGAIYETYDGDGTIRLYREHLVPLGQGETAAVSLIPSIGDVDGDGLEDAGQRVSILAGSETKQHDLAVSGKAYEAVAQAAMGTPLGESLDGAGDDFIEIDPFGESAIDVIARDGATGAELWVTRLRPRGRTTVSTLARAADVTGDGKADLVMSVEHTEPGTLPPNLGGEIRKIDAFVLDGASGALLWDAQ